MSLVVAQLSTNGPVIVAETRVTFTNGRKSQPKDGVLKVVALSPHLAVCFAGDVLNGLKAIRTCKNKIHHGSDFDQLAEILREASTDIHASTDFLLCQGGGSNRLERIRNGRIESGLNSSWIGDQSAFEKFQEHREASRARINTAADGFASLTESQKLSVVMDDAMSLLLQGNNFPTVGDYPVRLSPNKDGLLLYKAYATTVIEREITLKPGERMPLFQSVEEGGYTMDMVPPEMPGTAALLINFPLAQITYLLLPLRADDIQVIRGVHALELRGYMLETYGLIFSLPMISS